MALEKQTGFGLAGGVLGLIVGVVVGLVIVGNDDDAPTYNFIAVTTAAPESTTSTLASVVDDALAVAPSDTGSSASAAPSRAVELDDSPCDAVTKMPPGLPVIKCDRSPTVRLVQELLVALGYEVQVDGDFGPDTQAAVAEFQKESDLPVDGIVDGPTFDRLCTSAPGALCTG